MKFEIKYLVKMQKENILKLPKEIEAFVAYFSIIKANGLL